MQRTEKEDLELIKAAQQAIRLNYDSEHCLHTVGAAVRCKNAKIYVGVNVYSLHGACAEQVAIGTAITNGEREFDAIVAVRGKDGIAVRYCTTICRSAMSSYRNMAR